MRHTKEAQLKALWQRVFHDTDAFIRLFFDQLSPQDILTIKEEGKVISSLYLLPYQMTFCDSIIRVAYICGVATEPDKRSQGYAGQLMQQAAALLAQRDVDLSLLIPAEPSLFPYYQRFGYTTAFDYSIEEITPREKVATLSDKIMIRVAERSDFAYYDHKQRARPCGILHSESAWETVRQDFLLSGGNVWVALMGGEPCGMAFAFPQAEHGAMIKELLYDTPEVQEALITSVMSALRASTAELRTAPHLHASIPYGMASMINKERIIALWRAQHPDEQRDLHAMTDTELTAYLLQYNEKRGYLNLMLD